MAIINASNTSGLVQTGDASGVLALQTGGTTAVTIDTSQNVGIGTSSPSARLQILSSGAWSSSNWGKGFYVNTSGSACNPAIGISDYTGANNWALVNLSGNLTFNTGPAITDSSTAGVERMRIDSSGRITSPYQPAFLATCNTVGFPTIALGSYFTFNTLSTTFSNSNQNTGFSTSNYYYTAPVAGTYIFYVQIYFVNSGNYVSWWKNGSQVSFGDAAIAANSTTAGYVFNGSIMLNLAAGDYVGLQPRAGLTSVQWYPGHSCFYGYLLG